MLRAAGMVDKLEELPIYREATAFGRAVTALLERSALGKDRQLKAQISDAIDSITSNMSEGFEQPTDRAFEKYLFHSKASLSEVLERLKLAQSRNYITEEELSSCTRAGEGLGRMLGGFIRYLARSDFKERGRRGLRRSSSGTRD